MMDLLVLRTPAFCGLQWQKHTKVWLGPTLNSRLLKPQTKPFLPTSQVNPKPKPPKPCVVSGARTWKLWGFGLCGCDCRTVLAAVASILQSRLQEIWGAFWSGVLGLNWESRLRKLACMSQLAFVAMHDCFCGSLAARRI